MKGVLFMQKKEVKLEVRVTQDTYEKLKALAAEDESSCSAIVRKDIKKLLDNKEAK